MAADHVETIRRAAIALDAATHILIGAGAGMSADSGLRTYADAMHAAAAAQVALDRRPGAQLGSQEPLLTYHDLCQPTALLQHALPAYSFWATSLQAFRQATPHYGYTILERICASKARDSTCVYTSNVDGLFRRFPTLGARLHEIHGCAEEWACGSSLGFARDEATGRVESRGGVFEEHNESVECAKHEAAMGQQETEEAEEAEATTPWPAACQAFQVTPPWRGSLMPRWVEQLEAARSSTVTRHEGAMLPGAVQSETAQKQTTQSADGETAEKDEAEAAAVACWSNGWMPRCPCCHSPLRPSVVMFGDTDPRLLDQQAAAASAYQSWEEATEATVAADPASFSLVCLEIGCGERVPSVKRECEDVTRDTLRRGGRAVLIRINPEAPQDPHAAAGDGSEDDDDEGAGPPLAAEHVLTVRDCALRGLERIEAAIRDLQAQK